MMTFATTVHCMTCGKTVSGIDAELGIVVRAHVECPECVARVGCINCGAEFGDREAQHYFAEGEVGPFCGPCAGRVREGRSRDA